MRRTATTRDHALVADIAELRDQYPIIEAKYITAIARRRGAQVHTGAEARVYVDPHTESVYKVIEIENGRLRGGFSIGWLQWVSADRIGYLPQAPATALEFLARVHLNDCHGGLVYTEWQGVTADGDLVVKQPYIRNLARIRGQHRRAGKAAASRTDAGLRDQPI